MDFASRPHAQRAPRPAGADVLVDFKMLHLGVARYTSVAAQTQRAAAVASRARAVHTDYQLMARQRDERHHHVGARAVAAGHLAPGPVLALMQSYVCMAPSVGSSSVRMQRPRLMCIAC